MKRRVVFDGLLERDDVTEQQRRIMFMRLMVPRVTLLTCNPRQQTQ